MKLIFVFLLAYLPTSLITDNKELASTYIYSFKEIAIEEMQRTGIPASIKLAQGLLESDWGRSDLAKSANNHFGIKCGGNWNGGTFYKEDDDKDQNGELIESCFRSFASPLESYMAHSDFLTDPRKEYRYGFLFEYSRTDYKAWAKGLRKSGYATDPKYSEKLIEIIERYELNAFDKPAAKSDYNYALGQPNESKNKASSSNNFNKKTPALPSESTTINSKVRAPRMTSKYVSKLAYDLESINDTRMVFAKGGESLKELSKAVGLSVEVIMEINEIYDQSNVILDSYEIIYLEKKKRSFSGDLEYHLVKEGETMESIAQKYGLRVKSLYAKNRMPKGSQTIPGVRISLRKTVGLHERPSYNESKEGSTLNLLFEDDDSVH